MKLNEEDLQKIGGFFKNLEDFCKINIKIIKIHIVYIDVWKGQSPSQSPIAAKPLEASGKAASCIYVSSGCNFTKFSDFQQDLNPKPYKS